MKLEKVAHSVYKTQYHIVWVTRYRHPLFQNKNIKNSLKEFLLNDVKKHHPDWKIKSVGIAKDHIHLTIIIPPKYTVANVISSLKKNSSRILREEYNFKNYYWDNKGIWGVGYFVSTINLDEKIIKEYVENQNDNNNQLELEF